MNTIIPRPPRLLCLCDSPTVHTGFGRVAQSLIRRWKPHFHRIDIYAINHDGDTPMPDSEWTAPAIRLLRPRHPWYSTESLQRFLNLILSGEYTHVWIMQDLFLLYPNGFPGAFRQVCQKVGVRSLLYYPVDGPLDPEWTDMLRAVDVPVAYTGYGSHEAHRALNLRLRNPPTDGDPSADSSKALRPVDDALRDQIDFHIPHGVEGWFSRQNTDRMAVRKELFGDWVKPDDFLMVNVNQNSRRKAVWSSLAVLARMKEQCHRNDFDAKLLLHCPPVFDGIDLESIGRQLGLKYGVDWAHTGATWTRSNYPQWPDEKIRDLYHAADLNITTSLGEGWGLSITESLATGCPVAAPEHTACEWIMDRWLDGIGTGDVIGLPANHPIVVGESRLRYAVSPEAAESVIADWRECYPSHRVQTLDRHRVWLSWDLIAKQWIQLMEIEQLAD